MSSTGDATPFILTFLILSYSLPSAFKQVNSPHAARPLFPLFIILGNEQAGGDNTGGKLGDDRLLFC